MECVQEFWLGFVRNLPGTVHFVQFAGKIPTTFWKPASRGAGRALAEAVRIDAAHRDEIPSTKGTAGMIAMVDYGVGNLFSLKSSLAHLGLEAVVTADPARLRAADRIILPGVGAWRRHGETHRHGPCAGNQRRGPEKSPAGHLPG